LAQLADIPALITIHELLLLSKETKEALRDALANSESFLTHMPETLEMTLNPHVLNVIMYNQKYLLLLSQLRTCSSRIINTIDRCTIPDTSVRCALKEYRLIQGPHSALFPKGSSTFLAYHCISCLQSLLRYMILTQGVITHSERFSSVLE